MRADYLDAADWGRVTARLADPALIRAEIDERLDRLRTADPATGQRERLQAGVTQPARRPSGSSRPTKKSRSPSTTPDPHGRAARARETGLDRRLSALDTQLAGREHYLTLADNLEGFRARPRDKTSTATVAERQRQTRPHPWCPSRSCGQRVPPLVQPRRSHQQRRRQ